jgi:hypothetical protein
VSIVRTDTCMDVILRPPAVRKNCIPSFPRKSAAALHTEPVTMLIKDADSK